MKDHKAFWIIFSLAVAIRFINITMPILEGTATRQVQTAMIARNFYREGFDILHPKVDSEGNQESYLVLEFPILTSLAAAGYKILGGIHEWIGRIIVIFFFAGSFLFLYGIARRLFGETVALWTVIAYSFTPLSIIFSRTFMPDFIMLFFCIGSIYLMYRYYQESRILDFWMSCFLAMLSLLSKPQSFYISVPLIYLLWQKEGLGLLLKPKNWLLLLIVAFPAFLWYRHAGDVMRLSQTESYNYQFLNWFNPGLLKNKDFYIELINIYSGIFLTPLGLTLFIAGLFLSTERKSRLIWAWFCGAILYLVMFNTHITDPYYNLTVLPVASIFIARMIVFLSESGYVKKTLLHNKRVQAILAFIIFVFIARYALYAYVVPQGYRYIPEAGKKIQQISHKDELIIASAAGGPQALYYCDRKGWSFLLPESYSDEEDAIKGIRDYTNEGASYFLAAKVDDFEKAPRFKEYMFKNHNLVEYQKDKFIIFKLRQAR